MMRASELVFLPGFDGAAELRRPFLDAMARRFTTRAVSYPNRELQTLNGYARFAAATSSDEARPVLVAESFSGLVAVRWAARDPHVAALVLCASFARNPQPWLTSVGASLPLAVKLGAHLLPSITLASSDALRRQWSSGLSRTLSTLEAPVVAERLRMIAGEDIGDDLAALRIPVVLVQFEGDRVIGARARRELEAACPRAEVLRIDGPHFALETRPAECAAAIGLRVGALF
jgi:pimeloyl-[acyl-carrier protein] methyl ester esterase